MKKIGSYKMVAVQGGWQLWVAPLPTDTLRLQGVFRRRTDAHLAVHGQFGTLSYLGSETPNVSA